MVALERANGPKSLEGMHRTRFASGPRGGEIEHFAAARQAFLLVALASICSASPAVARKTQSYNRAVQRFAEAFVRNRDGSWFCRAPVQFMAVAGEIHTVTPGVTYRRGKLVHGVDIAQWLDDWHAHGASPPGVNFF